MLEKRNIGKQDFSFCVGRADWQEGASQFLANSQKRKLNFNLRVAISLNSFGKLEMQEPLWMLQSFSGLAAQAPSLSDTSVAGAPCTDHHWEGFAWHSDRYSI